MHQLDHDQPTDAALLELRIEVSAGETALEHQCFRATICKINDYGFNLMTGAAMLGSRRTLWVVFRQLRTKTAETCLENLTFLFAVTGSSHAFPWLRT